MDMKDLVIEQKNSRILSAEHALEERNTQLGQLQEENAKLREALKSLLFPRVSSSDDFRIYNWRGG